MPMSSPTSRSDSGRRYGKPLSRNSFWNFTMDCETLRSVRWRWSTLLISHIAERSFCSTYWRASSPELRSSERYSELTRSRGIPSSFSVTTYSVPILWTTTSGTMYRESLPPKRRPGFGSRAMISSTDSMMRSSGSFSARAMSG